MPHRFLFTLVIHSCLDTWITFWLGMATTIDLTWQLHLCRHGNAFVQAWQMQLCMHGNPGVALHLSKAWQMQLSMNGTAPVQIMANAVVQAWQLHLSYVHSPESLSTNSLHSSHLCTTLMAGTWLPPDATCCMKVLHFFRYNSWVFCHPLQVYFSCPHQYVSFSYALPWFATLASWSWLPIHLSVLAPCDWTCHGAPLSVFWS